MKKIQFDISRVKEIIAGMDDKARYGIFAGILLLIFLMDYFLIMNPQLKALTKLGPEKSVLQKDIIKVQDDFKKIQIYKNDVESLNKHLETVKTKVLTKEDLPIILKQISSVAENNNVQIIQVMPKLDDMTEILQDQGRKYYSLPIEVTAKAGYHGFGKFLNDLELGEIFIDVKEFDITALPDNVRLHNVKARLNAVVY